MERAKKRQAATVAKEKEKKKAEMAKEGGDPAGARENHSAKP